jgi:hypothetical protein
MTSWVELRMSAFLTGFRVMSVSAVAFRLSGGRRYVEREKHFDANTYVGRFRCPVCDAVHGQAMIAAGLRAPHRARSIRTISEFSRT